MMQLEFANKAKIILSQDENVIGLAVAGSWLTNEIDEFSDLDLIVVTKEKITDDKHLMLDYAKSLGEFISGFTGEHVGEPRVLICLYDHPLLHVDIKFVTIDEFETRVETPTILFDRNDQLKNALEKSKANFPYPDYQWIEDRFWTWIHYALLKIGRGEYLEAYDFLSFLRMVVFGPLLHIKNDNLPRGVRKVEKDLAKVDFESLISTIPFYDKTSLLNSLENGVELYRQLRVTLYINNVITNEVAEQKVMKYFNFIKNKE
ncbi:nucleotidyltransferase domain-containing protein [Pedobacter psychrotolerans]|uniref:Oxalate:formate antiporter n=2 Tax=Pedobacter psychrotolerans TaxID=1843235 RepID=A0ABQ1STI4_9SPHI|nr:nucleotidyltransferase domain-containing protein [Pedobacter psychrotolerans]GGE55254.1 oxalate:formate antiporter [Pedobacter psychrotolerans]